MSNFKIADFGTDLKFDFSRCIGTLNIDKTSQNGEFQEKLERNVIHAQIRNIFDIEFNKKFQGSI